MKRIKANNVLKTLNWLDATDKDKQASIEPKLNKFGLYECVIKLPLIEKTVIGLGESKIDSIDSATTKAAFLIDNYRSRNHSQINPKRYYLEEDDDGCLHIQIYRKEDIC